jgi:hypothetical protein
MGVSRLIQIDVVRLQSAQGIRGGAQDVGFRQSPFSVTHVHANFGGHDDFFSIPASFHPFAENFLRLSARVAGNPLGVHIRSVNGIESRLCKSVEQLE